VTGRRAVKVYAESVVVCCPHCGQQMPSKTGSYQWTEEDFRADYAVLGNCVDCNGQIRIVRPSRVEFI
jgi:hypothetical protein